MMNSVELPHSWNDLATSNFFDTEGFTVKQELPVRVEVMYQDRQLLHSPFESAYQSLGDELMSLTPLLTPDELKVKTERNTSRLVPDLSSTTSWPKCYGTGVGDDWQDQPTRNWTPDQVYAWLHQCMFEMDHDYSDIYLPNFYLSGRQLCQMTRDDFYRSAPKTGGILYSKLQSRLHIGAYSQPIIFSEDPCDDDVSSDLLLDVQDDSFNLFGSIEECEEMLDLILGKEDSVMDNNSNPPPSPLSSDPPSPGSSISSASYYAESDLSSLPPSPLDAISMFAQIETGVLRQRNNSAGEETSEDDSDIFSDTKSERSTDGTLFKKKVSVTTTKSRGGKNLQMLQKKLQGKRPRGRPRKIKLESSSDEDDEYLMCTRRKGEGMKGNHLWEFIRDLLKSPSYNPDFIKWEDANNGVFRIVHSEAVAKAWGKKKNNPRMTYEKLSRAMRYYYKRDILERVDGRRLVYKFGKKAYGWEEAARHIY